MVIRALTFRVFLLVAVVLTGMYLRASCASGELWFDEIWTLEKAQSVASPFSALFIRHDNAHPLTSVWMALLPPDTRSFVYRLPALFFSFVLLVMILSRSARSSLYERATYGVWLLMCATSYLLVLYGSEARGYSGLIATSAALFIFRERFSQGSPLVFCIVCIVGILSHALFLLTLAGFVLWQFFLWWHRECDWEKFRSVTGISCLLVLIVAAPLYKHLEIGGAPRLPYLEVLASTITQMIGGHALSPSAAAQSVWELFAALAVCIVCGIELYLWPKGAWRERAYLVITILLPLFAVAILQPAFILPRYFIVPVVVTYFIAARFIVRLAQSGVMGTIVAGSCVAAFVWVNTSATAYLAVEGRSRFAHTLSIISALSPHASFSGNQDFQTKVRLSVPEQLSESARALSYVTSDATSGPPPQFIIIESIDRFSPSAATIKWESAGEYERVSHWQAPGESGANLTLYRRKNGN